MGTAPSTPDRPATDAPVAATDLLLAVLRALSAATGVRP